MFIGNLLLSIASLLLLIDIYMLSKSNLSAKSSDRKSQAFMLSILGILSAFLLYVSSFLRDDFSLKDVYAFSSTGLPVLYKLYASWASVGGSLILWSALLALVYLVYRQSQIKRSEFSLSRVYTHLDVFLILLLAATILADPFAELNFIALDGLGLNPLLQSPWMAVHPPIIFLGYVLPFFPLAMMFAYLSKSKGNYEKTIIFFTRLSWLLFTLGIALGGAWAYEVLGWGGYWSWDPVETASLLPWLMLTAFFHTASLSNGNKTLVREFSILAASLLVIFATLITRSGILESVHAFGASAATAMPFILLFAYFCGYFIYLKSKVKKPIIKLSSSGGKTSLSLTLAYVSLLYITVVCILGILLPALLSIQVGGVYSLGKEFYNTWLFPPTILFVISLIFCNSPKRFGLKACIASVILAVLIGILAVTLNSPTPNQVTNFGLPILFLAFSFALYNLFEKMLQKKRVHILSHLGRSMIHASLILILIGVFLSSSMEVSEEIPVKINEVKPVLGVELKVTNLRFSGPIDSIYTQDEILPAYSSLVIDVEASSDGRIYDGQLWTGLYTLYGLTSRPLIFRLIQKDIYITVGFTEPLYQNLIMKLTESGDPNLSQLMIQVKIIPFVNLIWIGVSFLSIGIIISMMSDFRKSKKLLE
ncbi:MAG: cytochrome c biogenesis protein CcsA [Candidatus Bathyarchaeota archaeon]|nr:cytochrome c biogenesis protein CcsA [Candidatus Bathyarchaeota archaeon]